MMMERGPAVFEHAVVQVSKAGLSNQVGTLTMAHSLSCLHLKVAVHTFHQEESLTAGVR